LPDIANKTFNHEIRIFLSGEGIMKRSVSFLVILIVLSLLSGCILSKTPKTSSVTTLPGTEVSFSVTIFPSKASYAWTLDDTPLADATNSYKYTPSYGKHVLIVTAKHSLGTDTWTWNILDAEVAVPVNSAGGTVAVTDTSSPLAGTQVIIPVNALHVNATVTISGADAPSGLPGKAAGQCVDFGPEGTQFSNPVELSLPYADANNDGIVDGTGVSEDQVKAYYYNKTTSAWDEVTIIGQDTVNNLVRINATHFSEYITGVDSSITWQRLWGGNGFDTLMGVHQTSDGGYLCAGTTDSSDISGVTVNGPSDLYVAKLNATGEIIWQKTYGGSGYEGDMESPTGTNILTSDGGLVIGSTSTSLDVPGSPNHGAGDAYIVRTDANGEILWQHLFGGTGGEGILSLDATTDGGFIIAGYSTSTDIPGTVNNGSIDCYVIKLNGQGDVEWQKLYGGSEDYLGISIIGTHDGGSILLTLTHNPSYYKILKLDAQGEVEWEKVLTKKIDDSSIISERLLESTDGGYIFVGGDGDENTWWLDVVKMYNDGTIEWEYTTKGLSSARGIAVTQTSDGGYAVTGLTGTSGTNWGMASLVVKLDELGKEQWERYNFPTYWFTSIEETSDMGYILGGFIWNNADTTPTFVVRKLDSMGNLQLLDSDGDGILDVDEIIMGTNPFDADTDDDGLTDGQEDSNHNGIVDLWETDPRKADTDGDGIQDGTELGITSEQISSDTDTFVFQPDLDPTTTTNPLLTDTDNDGISDGIEDANHNGRLDSGESDPAHALNSPPVANAGWDQKVLAGDVVTLYGSFSKDPDNNIIAYQWVQTGGPSVSLDNANSSNPQFVANAPLDSVLTFVLTVTDAEGVQSQDSCIVSIVNAPADNWSNIDSCLGHTVAIKTDGTLWSWGWNTSGQLGDGTTTDKYVPTRIGNETDWISVSTGSFYTIAIKSDGTLWAWGMNYSGQLGVGNNTDRYVPTQIGTDTDWASVSAGWMHTMAIKDDGSLWAWGNNSNRRLGTAFDISMVCIPTRVGTDKDWVVVAAGWDYTMAIKSDGSLWGWGSNCTGELGLGQSYYGSDFVPPRRVDTSTNWLTVVAGKDFYHNTVAIKTDGSLWAWGNGTPVLLYPTRIGNENDWMAIDVGEGLIVALKVDHSLWAWGDNEYGQLGDGTLINKYIPTQIGDDYDWIMVCSDSFYATAIKVDHSLWAWGSNEMGQFGDGTKTDKYVPTRILN
jgi:alpha-tubulin suppressor-like RCC1 family protein